MMRHITPITTPALKKADASGSGLLSLVQQLAATIVAVQQAINGFKKDGTTA